ncbi:hypothetical protein EV196_106212 [Mariniflexile fucanivorans]|uniref:Uncharacterized protein n=1 Tax=Mariniflexile fucanivorans TaxID=264023 RepID=A0A4R1RGC3_9FLAO|nr:hypothetical protein EV196_106212 [Mariniflexile fucanivorans]
MYQYCIYPKDISIILGKSISHSSNLVRIIKQAYVVTSPRPITIKKFCGYMDFPFDDIFHMINGKTSRTTS